MLRQALLRSRPIKIRIPTPKISAQARSYVRFSSSLRPRISFFTPSTLGQTHSASLAASLRARVTHRSFHSSRPRYDILFVTLPTLKSTLLAITRSALLVLPFMWRYRMFKKYPKASWTIVQIPLFAICIILALGIDQAPRSHRWRLLLMSEREEMEWSERRFEELLMEEGRKILPEEDNQVQLVKRICDNLIAAVDEQQIFSSTAWPRDMNEIATRIKEFETKMAIQPSARTDSKLLPFRPETSNPTKVIEPGHWELFIIDLPKINAFVLPSKEIFIYTGLLDFLDNEEPLLAAILAHEISHVTQRHTVENMGFLATVSIFFDILRGLSYAFTISFPVLTDMCGSILNFLNDTVASRAYSRKLETEADLVGLNFMAKAGYDPRAAMDLWDIMGQLEADMKKSQSLDERVPFLRTHPTNHQRLEDIEKALPKAMALFEGRSKSQLMTLKAPTQPTAKQAEEISREKAADKQKSAEAEKKARATTSTRT